MSELPNCPECDSEYTYQDGLLLVCPSCAHEWTPGEEGAADDDAIRDSNGNVLESG
ncbi:MAG: alkylphosphonate utilization protein, partial [bacterium]|nr:alkylphosphonate utilization protein [bacterium]